MLVAQNSLGSVCPVPLTVRGNLDEVLGWTLAAVGFYFQYTQMFSPPFVVELLLWPLQTIEYGLLYAVASTSAPAAA